MYGKEISPALAEMYFNDLSDFSIEAIQAAMSAHRKDSDRGRWFPKVADLIDKLETKRVTYETSNHPSLVAERSKAVAVRSEGRGLTIWERMGYRSEADYYAGRRLH